VGARDRLGQGHERGAGCLPLWFPLGEERLDDPGAVEARAARLALDRARIGGQLETGDEEPRLAGEVVVDEGGAHPCSPGHGANRRRGVALGELRSRGSRLARPRACRDAAGDAAGSHRPGAHPGRARHGGQFVRDSARPPPGRTPRQLFQWFPWDSVTRAIGRGTLALAVVAIGAAVHRGPRASLISARRRHLERARRAARHRSGRLLRRRAVTGRGTSLALVTCWVDPGRRRRPRRCARLGPPQPGRWRRAPRSAGRRRRCWRARRPGCRRSRSW
jgi:hypothetical protein